MEGQTAPESTRGLFDPPQEPKVKRKNNRWLCEWPIYLLPLSSCAPYFSFHPPVIVKEMLVG